MAIMVASGACPLPGTTAAADAPDIARPYFLRNQSPILHIFGVPAPEGGRLAPDGRLHGRVAFTVVNHADSADHGDEGIVLDGETYFADLVLRRRVAPRWELGLDVPYVAHHNGRLDNLIEGWHDAFGLTNSRRQGPSNQLRISYSRNGRPEVELTTPGGGLGDVRISAAYQIAADGGRALALRGTLKLPTGDADRLRGSGGTDLALALDTTHRVTLARRELALSAQAGALYLGEGDVLADQQKDLVPFASLGVGWSWTRRLGLRAQLAYQGKYFDSRLDELGSGTANLAVGGLLRLDRLGVVVDIALVEDLVSDATPDFGAYLSIRRLRRDGALL